MTSAVFTIKYYDEEIYFHFYKRSDSNPDDIIKVINNFCKDNDNDTLRNKGRLNWDYISSSLFSYILKEHYNKDISSNNTMKVISPYYFKKYKKKSIYEYEISPIKELYQDFSIPLFDAIEVKTTQFIN